MAVSLPKIFSSIREFYLNSLSWPSFTYFKLVDSKSLEFWTVVNNEISFLNDLFYLMVIAFRGKNIAIMNGPFTWLEHTFVHIKVNGPTLKGAVTHVGLLIASPP